MRLLFLNRFYAPDVSATAQLLTDLAEDLVGRAAADTLTWSEGPW
jgi:hypothetical protein